MDGSAARRPLTGAFADELPGAADWTAMAGKRTPRSLQPLYAIQSHRREISSYSDALPPASVPWLAGSRSRASPRNPSNRSEAAQLAERLDRGLMAAGHFRAQLAVYDAVFGEVVQQVAVHCSERGEILLRLKAFYSRSTDTTARLAEHAVREKMQVQLTGRDEEIAAVHAELQRERQRSKIFNDGSAQGLKRLYDRLPPVEKRKAAQLIAFGDNNNDIGGVAEVAVTAVKASRSASSTGSGSGSDMLVDLPREEQLALLSGLLGRLGDTERSELLRALLPERDDLSPRGRPDSRASLASATDSEPGSPSAQIRTGIATGVSDPDRWAK